jgi:hypothetical protein
MVGLELNQIKLEKGTAWRPTPMRGAVSHVIILVDWANRQLGWQVALKCKQVLVFQPRSTAIIAVTVPMLDVSSFLCGAVDLPSNRFECCV